MALKTQPGFTSLRPNGSNSNRLVILQPLGRRVSRCKACFKITYVLNCMGNLKQRDSGRFEQPLCNSKHKLLHSVIASATPEDGISVNGSPHANSDGELEEMRLKLNQSFQDEDTSNDLVQSLHEAARVFELAIEQQRSLTRGPWFAKAWLGIDKNAWIKTLAYQASVHALLQAATEIASRGHGRDRDVNIFVQRSLLRQSNPLENSIRDQLSLKDPVACDWFWSQQHSTIVTNFVNLLEKDPLFTAVTSVGWEGASLSPSKASDVSLLMLSLSIIAAVMKLGPAKVSCPQFSSTLSDLTGKLMNTLASLIPIDQVYHFTTQVGLRREFLAYFGPRAATYRGENDLGGEEGAFWVDLVQQQLRGAMDKERIWSRLTTYESIESLSQAVQGKRKESSREELSDGGTYYHRKTKSSGGGDYKKDREEWSDMAIGCLLDAYTEKYVQLNRGNLRGRDWEEVALVVSERCDKQKSAKSIEQCKNKVDNLKKRYKSERHRLSSGSSAVSHWPWYKKMDQIVGSAVAKTVSDEDKSMGGAGTINMARPSKRFSAVTPSPVGLSNSLKTKSLPIPRWRRVLLKISGTALAGNAQNVDPKVTMLIAREIAAVNRLGVEVAIIVGGRNFFCGSSWVGSTGLDRASADQIGMMATVMNSIILQASMENLGVQTRVQTAFKMAEVAEPYIRRRAIRHLEKGRVVIFGGGTGNPFFSTDTAAALRASEINAEVVLKGTNVDGVYDCDPRKNNNSIIDHISYRDFLAKGLSTAMDMTAITLCEENCIPVVVFNLHEPGNISRALSGDQIGTLIDQVGKIG